MVTGPYPVPAGGDFPPAGGAPPRPLTPRQEKFCQAYVACGNASEAAREAGYSKEWARKQGWRLLRADRVRARVLEIQSALGRELNDSLDPFIGKLEVIYRQAIADRRTLAAVRAVELQARLVRLKRRLPPAAEEAAAAFKAEVERRRARGRALAEWRRASLSARLADGDADPIEPDADEQA
jgi:phage terminase small subunit